MQFAGSVRVGSRPAYGEDRDSAAACAALADVGVGAATGERFPAGRAASAGTGDPASISGLSNVLDSLCVQKKGGGRGARRDPGLIGGRSGPAEVLGDRAHGHELD
jgi:hypothetical protein